MTGFFQLAQQIAIAFLEKIRPKTSFPGRMDQKENP